MGFPLQPPVQRFYPPLTGCAANKIHSTAQTLPFLRLPPHPLSGSSGLPYLVPSATGAAVKVGDRGLFVLFHLHGSMKGSVLDPVEYSSRMCTGKHATGMTEVASLQYQTAYESVA